MLFAALTFWLLVIVFTALGVHQMWSSLIKPRVVNSILLPGTLIAQLGHIVGLLITGNPVRNTTLMGDDESGDPQSDTPDEQRIPILANIVIGLLPLVACAACLCIVANLWGGRVLPTYAVDGLQVSKQLPTSLPGFFDLLRGSVTIVEGLVTLIATSPLMSWSTILFLYLSICLTVRMAPIEGNRRGAIIAIVLSGLAVAIVATVVPQARDFIAVTSWPILSFAVSMLLALLLLTFIVTGLVGLIRIFANKD